VDVTSGSAIAQVAQLFISQDKRGKLDAWSDTQVPCIRGNTTRDSMHAGSRGTRSKGALILASAAALAGG
jgi:hypothetical protein